MSAVFDAAFGSNGFKAAWYQFAIISELRIEVGAGILTAHAGGEKTPQFLKAPPSLRSSLTDGIFYNQVFPPNTDFAMKNFQTQTKVFFDIYEPNPMNKIVFSGKISDGVAPLRDQLIFDLAPFDENFSVESGTVDLQGYSQFIDEKTGGNWRLLLSMRVGFSFVA